MMDRIIIRYVREGRDAHDWGFVATVEDWKNLTGQEEPGEIDQADCNRETFDTILGALVEATDDDPEVTDSDSPYIVICY